MKRYDYAPVPDDAPIPDPLVESEDGDWCDAQEALAAIAALTAENARLRAEVESLREPEAHWKSLALSQGKTITEQKRMIAHMQEALDEALAALARVTADAAAECGRLRESLAVDEAELASLREWLRDRTSERDDLLNSARDRNARHQRASFKHIAPVYICPTDDACIRLMRDSDKGRLTIFDEDLDSTGVYGVVEIDEQEGVNALFLALASYVDADTIRAAIAACAPPASGEAGYPYAPCPKCGQQAAHEGPVCAGCFTRLSLAARPAPAKEPT